jgi:hypothetical protein
MGSTVGSLPYLLIRTRIPRLHFDEIEIPAKLRGRGICRRMPALRTVFRHVEKTCANKYQERVEILDRH